MAIPNYTYLELKMLGPNGVITVSSAFSHAFACDREHYELATAVVNSSELPRLGELSAPAVLDCNKPTSSMSARRNQGGGNRPHQPNQDSSDRDPAPGQIGM